MSVRLPNEKVRVYVLARETHLSDLAPGQTTLYQHAFSYFPDEKILAVPILDWGWWNGQGKLALLKLDETSGFTKLADIQHNGEVLRSLRIDHFIYSIGTDAVKVISLDNPNGILTSVDLPPSPGPNPIPLPL